MPPRLIDLQAAAHMDDAVREAVETLSCGRLVVFPTETVYGLAARAQDEEAVQRLLEAKGRAAGHPLTLAIAGANESLDYCPDISVLGSRLARRCWPGPLTMVLDADSPLSLVAQFPEATRNAIAPHGEVGLRVPNHEVMLRVLSQIEGALVLTSANRTGEPDPQTASEVIKSLGHGVDLVLDGGAATLGRPSTVVRIQEHAMEVLREGAIPEVSLQRLSARMFLFVCTGNTCRSPMAEVFCEQVLAEQQGCDIEELETRGTVVLSAGLAALPGMPASENSQEIARRQGLSLADHQTQPVTETMIRYADRVYTMTQAHRRMILSQWPDAVDRVFTLAPDGSDISDPIGGPLEEYARCAEQIRAELVKRVAEWEE